MIEPDDFLEFVKQMLDGDDLDGTPGIASQAIADGPLSKFSPAQHASLSIAIKSWLARHFARYSDHFVEIGDRPQQPTCDECTNPVPWCEAYLAGVMFDGTCSYCQQVRHKGD